MSPTHDLSMLLFQGAPSGAGRGAKPVKAMREEELVLRARTDREAFAQLYLEHQPAIARYVRRRLGRGPESDDAIAETFTTALENIASFEARGVPFRAWLYRIALSRISRHVRSLRRSRTVLLSGDHPDIPTDEAARAERKEEAVALARSALLSLPRRYQEVLSLHYLEGLAVAEVAEILGLAQGTVKARLSRGRERLRRLIEPKLRGIGK